MNSTAPEKLDPMPAAFLGMWLFLASETMFFVGLLGAFIVLKSAGDEHQLFVQSSHRLSATIGLVSSICLLASSIAMLRPVRMFELIAMFLSICFLILQVGQWRILLQQDDGPWQNNFFGCYFLLSAAHALHLIGGLAAMSWYILVARRKLPDPVQIYWHFVNAIGVITLIALYLV